jgi:hypothetical protein
VKIALLVDRFPVLSETFVAAEARALRRMGHDVRVEAGGRAERTNPEAADIPASYIDRDGVGRRVRDLAWLSARHPLACLADLRDRRRWRRQEAVRPLRALASAARHATATCTCTRTSRSEPRWTRCAWDGSWACRSA